jgi:arabinogalactan oligomer/maltooligosaccharide transport system substrate-binding protein
MGHVNPAITVSVVTALVALISALIAIWQAVLARKQSASARRAADAAESQAIAAGSQAVAAQRQADAADRAATVAVSTLELESRREHTAEALLARSQSAQISAWLGWSATPEGWGVFLRNGSGAPVYHIHATVLGPEDLTEIQEVQLPLLPPSSAPLFHPLETDPEHDESTLTRSARRVRVTFTDEAGERWLRDQHGRLRRFEARLVVVATDAPRAVSLQQFAEEFQAAYGVTLTFQTIHTSISDELEPLFTTGSPGGAIVDALIGAHDWIGSLAHENVIEPIMLSKEHRDAFRSWTLDALTYDARLYGLPTTLDTTALIRNVDLVPQPPATMEDLIATGNDLRREGQVAETLMVRVTDQGDPFQLWPLFASAGGSLFDMIDGAWDPKRVILDSPASISAFDRLRSLGERGNGLLRRSMDRTQAFELFSSGQTPYLISGSDGLEHARRAGLRVAVSPVPPFTGGEPARGMSLVHGMFIAKGGRNQLLTHDLFSDYLTHNTVMAALSKTVVCPVALRVPLGHDAEIQEYQNICDASDPMPAFRGMRQVWEIVGRAQAAVIRGDSPEGAARAAAKEVLLALKSAGVYE